MGTRLVVALDVPTFERAKRLVDALGALDVAFKIGYEAYYGYGDLLVPLLEVRQAAYVLDLKLHDIPRTVHAAVRAVVRPGVMVLTAHALGGSRMLAAAVEASEERGAELGIAPPRVLAVTVLTSLAHDDLAELGLGGGPGENAMRLAGVAQEARCGGVVCSVGEAAAVKQLFGTEFAAMCPGVRPAGSTRGDQRRVATPREARDAGVDYIVVGRPIVDDADPAGAAQAILADLTVTA